MILQTTGRAGSGGADAIDDAELPPDPDPTTTAEPGTNAQTKNAPGQSASICKQAAQSGDVNALVSAFITARVSGGGAEGCLSRRALLGYCTDTHPCPDAQLNSRPEVICLYRCLGYHVAGIERERDLRAGEPAQVILGLVLDRDAQPPGAASKMCTREEALTVGHGVPSTGGPAGLIFTAAVPTIGPTTTPCSRD